MKPAYKHLRKERLLKRIALSVSRSRAAELTGGQRYALFRLIRRLQRQLTAWRPEFRLSALFAASVVALGVLTGSSSAQSFGSGQQNPFGLASVGGGAAPCFGDLDGDGDLDMLSGESGGSFRYFRNIGDAECPEFDNATTNPFSLTSIGTYSSPVLADMDADGDLDLLAGGNYSYSTGFIVYFPNVGTPTNPSFNAPLSNPFGISLGAYVYFTAPTVADLDNDGDSDVMLGELYGNFLYYQNTGTSAAPAFGAVQVNPFGLSAIGEDFSAPNFVDIDGDGDLDLMSGGDAGNILFFQNTGTAASPSFGLMQTNPFGLSNAGPSAFPFFTDIDDDSDMDGFAGEYPYGNFTFYENTEITNTPPTGDDDAVTLVQNNTHAFQPSDFSFADVDGNAFRWIQITQLESVGDLEFSGNPVNIFQTIPVGSIGSLTFTPQTGQFGLNYDNFRFKVGDCLAFSNNDYQMTLHVDQWGLGMPKLDHADIRLFPNPSTTEVRLLLPEPEEGELVVHDATGAQVHSQIVPHQRVITINTSGWPAGLYRLSLNTARETTRKDFVVVR